MKKLLINALILAVLAGFFHACEKATVKDDSFEEMDLKSANSSKTSYIVVLGDADLTLELFNLKGYEMRQAAVKAASSRILNRAGVLDGEVEHVYGTALQGFSVKIPPGQLKKLENDPAVRYIEKDEIVSLVKPISISEKGDFNAQAQVTPYGITRVGGGATYGDDQSETKVVWVIDTGIDLDHPDLNVDVSRGAYFTGRGTKSPNDDNGHGTHVAGTIAAINNGQGVIGVAAGATVVAVKVLDKKASGYWSWIIAGIDYVAEEAESGDIANLSLLGGVTTAVDDAVIALGKTGVKVAMAAGNESDDANNYSPARVNGPNLYTVSAMDINDNFASFSNYGTPPVDYCEPGVSVYSTYIDGGYATASGTSMAAPHMAGILVWGVPSTDGTVNGDPDGDGNADPIGVVGGGETPNSPPSADFTFTTSDLTGSFTDASTDSDGTVTAWSWDFGDGNTSNVQNLSHPYSAEGTYTVTIAVTDDDGATDSESKSVTVTDPVTGYIILTATGRKVRGIRYVDLSWSGNSSNVDIYRDGGIIEEDMDGSTYTDNLQRSSGTFTYQVCETGTSTCSNEASVTF